MVYLQSLNDSVADTIRNQLIQAPWGALDIWWVQLLQLSNLLTTIMICFKHPEATVSILDGILRKFDI